MDCARLAVGQNQWYHFGVGAPPILVYFSGDSLGVRFGFWPMATSPSLILSASWALRGNQKGFFPRLCLKKLGFHHKASNLANWRLGSKLDLLNSSGPRGFCLGFCHIMRSSVFMHGGASVSTRSCQYNVAFACASVQRPGLYERFHLSQGFAEKDPLGLGHFEKVGLNRISQDLIHPSSCA